MGCVNSEETQGFDGAFPSAFICGVGWFCHFEGQGLMIGTRWTNDRELVTKFNRGSLLSSSFYQYKGNALLFMPVNARINRGVPSDERSS